MTDTPPPVFLFAAIAVIFVLGGFVKGVVGLGLPTIALAATLGGSGSLHATALAGSALALLPALLGMGTGTGQWLRLRLRLRLQPETVKTVFFCGLLALGAYLTIHSALHLG